MTFWQLSPSELDIYLAGAEKRLSREHDQLAWSIWTNAAMVRSNGKMPPLEKLQINPSTQSSAEPSQEADIAALMAWDTAINRKH